MAAAQSAPAVIPGQTPSEVDPSRQVVPPSPRQIDPVAVAQQQPCSFAGQGRITLTRIVTEGATLVPADDITAATAGLLNVEQDLAVLCTARDRVAQLYAERGEALVRVDLPQQRISGGVLVLKVTEGAIARTTLRNAEALGPSAVLAQRYLSALETGNATRWQSIERAFILTRELPGSAVDFSIRSARDIGPAALDAVATFGPRRKVDIALAGQNFGSGELGRVNGLLRIDFNGFTSLGERTSIVASSSANGNQRVFQLLEEVRVGSNGLTLTGDVAYGQSRPGGALEALDLDGESVVGRVGARFPLVRQRGRAVDVGARIEFVDQKNALGFLEAIGGAPVLLSRENLRIVSAEIAGQWAPRAMRNLSLAAGLEVRQGLAGLGATDRNDPLRSRSDARPDFTSIRGNLGLRKDFVSAGAMWPWLSAQVSGQWSPHGLPAYEEFQIGNYTVGRGYDPGAASGDRAIGVQLEGGLDLAARVLPALFGHDAALGMFGFFDAARLWNVDPTSYDARISSFGGGLRLRGTLTQINVFYARPRTEPLPLAGKPGGRLLVSLTRNFSVR